MTIELSGRIDTNNAAQAEKDLQSRIGNSTEPIKLDAAKLDYISSAGLRILLRIRKKGAELRIVNVKPEIYQILDETGFTQIMSVEKALRRLSVEGCEEIGHGANGSVYRWSDEIAVKVYRDGCDPEDIRHEREMAKLALVLGIPTAISYDVVRVGEQYGTVFELLNARSFSSIIAKEPDKLDWCVREFAGLLRQIHDTEVPAGTLPDMKQNVLGWVDFLRDYLPEAAWSKLRAMTEAVPEDRHMLHGDYHTKNLEIQNGEVLIIDMDTLSVGHPIFELGSVYNSLLGFSELDHSVIQRFQGYSYETAGIFWRRFLESYLGCAQKEKLREVEEKARIVGYVRLIRRSIRRGGLDTEAGQAEIEHWRQELMGLLNRNDRLDFSRDELNIPAKRERLDAVQAFVAERLGSACSFKSKMNIELAVEEIFINIASYAYGEGDGTATVRVERSESPAAVTISFTDRGVPYNPLAKDDPDVTSLAQERKIGGLGIFLTKKVMDEVRYEYRDGQNILTMTKKLS
ncbi:MAG: ATP-binding protein [Oscillospiraceae bacterium]|nr:ATP-binding protein [Oscillospiraceae bacterium]